MNQRIVSIVMGKAPCSQTAPSNSYINVQAFPNPKALADYLLKLDKSPNYYLSYFWWKDKYVLRTSRNSFLCQLCDKLNSKQTPKIYHDLTDWRKQGSHCEKKETLKWTKAEQSWFMDAMNGEATEMLGEVFL